MESHLKWSDYLILVGFLVISLGIGIYHSLTGGRQKTTAEFIMANRQLSVIPTAISLIVSFQSAILLLGMTAEMYSYGAQFLIFYSVGTAVALFFVERMMVPWLYPMKLVSIYDYLDRRYMSKNIRIFASSLGIVSGIMFMGVSIYAPSAALESATGLPLAASIPIMAVVCLTYTALGGMRAVIWTDVFMFFMLMGGTIAILVKGLILAGGITNVFRVAGEEGRLDLANISFDPRERHTVWNLTIGMIIGWINGYGLNQASVQRFSAVKSLSEARIMILLNIPVVIILNAMACVIGLIVLAYYSSVKCDPVANGDIVSPNQLLPYFVITIFAGSPGFAGLFLATLYGGSLSAVSSFLSGTAANCWEDILKWKLNHLPEKRKAIINRLLVVLFGALATGVAFLSATVTGPVTQLLMAMCSSVVGPLMAFFILGAVSRHANWKGTMVGGVMGVVLTLWLCIGSLMLHHKHPALPPVSVEQCSAGNGNSTLLHSSLNYNNYTSFELLDGTSTTINWNRTTDYVSGAPHYSTELRGLDNFYAISYLWFLPFGATVTGIIGIIASFIMRDKKLEEMVDERLLMRFHGCGWSDKNGNKEYLDEKNCGSLQETNPLKGPDDGFLKDMDMTVLRETDNGFHGEMNCDVTKDIENGLHTKDDSGKASGV